MGKKSKTVAAPEAEGEAAPVEVVKEQEVAGKEEKKEKKAPEDKKGEEKAKAEPEADPIDEVMASMRKDSIFITKDRLVAFGRFRTLLLAPEARDVFRKFAIATTLMLLLPVTAFYMVMDLAENYGVPAVDAPTYGAIAAGIVVQFVSFGYVAVAWIEERDMKRAAVAEKKEK